MIAIDVRHVFDRPHQDALATASAVLVDQLLDDLVDLRSGVHASETGIVGYLPPTYRGRYDGHFLRRFAVCLQVVAWKLFSRNAERLASVAEELALYIILEQAEAVVESEGVESDFSVMEAAFEDMDFEWLYDPASDGIEDSNAARELRMVNLAFNDWFKPFRGDDPVYPYVDTDS